MANNNDAIRAEVARQIEIISSDATLSLQYLNPPLNETEMVAIADAVNCNTHAGQVCLRWCLTSGSPAAVTSTFITKILKTHPSLKKIYLDFNKLDDNLAVVIGDVLKANTSLKKLGLSANNFGPPGAESLANGLCCNSSLKVLRLSCNQVGDRGAAALAQALRINKTLKRLLVEANKVGDRGAAALAEALRINKTLQQLYISGNNLGDGGAAALAGALRENKSLEKLYLANCGVSVNGAKALASALEKASLKILNLNNNNLQDEGGKAIAQILCKNKSLTRLDLYLTSIGDETCKALASALCNNSSLKMLVLDANSGITNAGVKAFEDTLKHMNFTVVNIRFNICAGVNQNQVQIIQNLCSQNNHLYTFFQRINQNIPTIPPGVWPKVLETVECKPDLLFALLKTNPDVCWAQIYE